MAKERTVYTEEQVAEIKRRRDERNAATNAIVGSIIAASDPPAKNEWVELRKLAILAAPKSGGRSGTGVTRTSVMSIVSGIFDKTKEISEDQIFIDHKLGRTEMATATKNIIKKFAPADRKWISFDPESGVYKLAGKGENPPRGWKGYVPVDETLDDDDDADSEQPREEREE